MTGFYDHHTDLGSHALGRIAIKLREKQVKKSRLSPLVFITDPARVPDLAAAVAGLPKGVSVEADAVLVD